jgi:starvation-inducible DNA-binding protein
MEGSKTARALAVALAETYALMAKSHGYHWNVTGPYFKELHDLFQVQYEELFIAVDEIAEHLRTFGVAAPGSLGELAALSAMSPASAEFDDQAMLQDLAASNELARAACKSVLRAAEAAGDDATMDLMTDRIRAHGKAVWMLRASMATASAKAGASAAAAVPPRPEPERPKKKKEKPPKPAKPPKADSGKARAPAPPQPAKAAPKAGKPAPLPSGRPKPAAKASG